MPASARPRSVRSLSPSLLPSAPHRYLPYHRINSTFTFGEPQQQKQQHRVGDVYGCERFGKMTIADTKTIHRPQPHRAYPPMQKPGAQQRMKPGHRRAVSLSAMPVTHGYILLPTPSPAPSQAQRPQRPQLTRPASYPYQKPSASPAPAPGATARPGRISPPRPLNLAPSAPLTPIQESPRPSVPVPAQGGNGLMLMTPTIAAFLQRGGSVSVRGADGKAWRVRAPMVRVQ